jgi:hypothetical protein
LENDQTLNKCLHRIQILKAGSCPVKSTLFTKEKTIKKKMHPTHAKDAKMKGNNVSLFIIRLEMSLQDG